MTTIMNPVKIVIEISRGCLVGVYVNTPDAEVDLIDHDNEPGVEFDPKNYQCELFEVL